MRVNRFTALAEKFLSLYGDQKQMTFASRLASLSKRKFQPILFVDSLEIRLWKSTGPCQMNLSYSPVIFIKKNEKWCFCVAVKSKKDFWTQIRFDKWSWMIETCSFLTTSLNFMLMYVRRLNNYQNSLFSPFLEIFQNGFFDHVRKFLQMCLHAASSILGGKNFLVGKKFCAPCLIILIFI